MLQEQPMRWICIFCGMLAGLIPSIMVNAQPMAGRPTTRPAFQIAKVPINPSLPTLWIIGDSTVRNGSKDDGNNGQWGWGNPIRHYFDETKLNVQNRAVGGTSSRSFQDAQWPWILEEIKPGDYLILQFGHNDSGTPKGNSDETVQRAVQARGRGRGRGAATTPTANAATPQPPTIMETLHTFGWYLRKYVTDAKDHGVVAAVICSPIPRNRWSNGTISPDGWDATCKEAAETCGAQFIDLNAMVTKKYTALGEQKVTDELFPVGERVHPDWAGAVLNAETVIEGLKEIHSPLVQYLKPEPPTNLTNPSGRAR